MSFSTKHIEYLERHYLDQSWGKVEVLDKDLRIPVSGGISLLKVQGVSRFWEQYQEKIPSARYLMQDVAGGLCGQKRPLLYILLGEPTAIQLFMGTLPFEDHPVEESQALTEYADDLSVLNASLNSAYPSIELKEQTSDDVQSVLQRLKKLTHVGLIMGTPTTKVGTEQVGVEQIERLIRGMYGALWGYVVIARPVIEKDVVELYNSALNELRIVTDAERSADMQSPIAEIYREKVSVYIEKLEAGKTQGMWHTAAYFLAQDVRTFQHMKAVTKSVFGGEDSLPDPVRILECPGFAAKVHQMAQITTPAPPAPGKIIYPYKYLNLLNSPELSALTHLPMEESPGYFVKDYARFDVALNDGRDGEDVIEIGEVLDQRKRMGYQYRIDVDDLNRHGLIVGTTGAGKTNTAFHLLGQIWKKNIPFMVIEPAKTEYRKLLQGELGNALKVFTLGDDTTSPFRLNPFEIRSGVSVQTHIDHLKSVFNASFIMYAPMPYVLERCIHEIYKDKGWDLVTSVNERGIHANTQPTLADLYKKIDEVVDTLGYEIKITMDVKAALKTRINSLRIGGKGLMLDTNRSIPIEVLIQKPVILELEQIGDDDEKAFIIGLMLMALYEHYIAQGIKEGVRLRHVTVVEEAHRLLRNIPSIMDTEVANSKGKAVETFTNILSEVRAYGEGLLVVEQIPGKLSPDIIKSTNLKVMHRVVSEDDRLLMGGAMNLDEQQQQRIVSLDIGEAAVYSEGNDGSVLVAVPYSKIASSAQSKADENRIIRERMRSLIGEMPEVFIPFESYAIRDKTIWKYKDEAERIAETSEFMETLARYILSTAIRDLALLEELPQLLQTIRKFKKIAGVDVKLLVCTLIIGVHDYFELRGRQYGLRYLDVEDLSKEFVSLLIEIALVKLYKPNGQPNLVDTEIERVNSFQERYKKLFQCHDYPFSGCRKVCPDNICLYRYNMHPVLNDKRVDRKFNIVFQQFKGDDLWDELSKVCQTAIRRVISGNAPAEEKRKVGLCFAIQKIETNPSVDTSLRDVFMVPMINNVLKLEE